MANFLTPPAYKPERTDANVDADYKRLRWQVFIGIFIGYAGFYLVRKNLSMAVAPLGELGFNEAELGGAMAMNALAYGISKFVMASVSDRSSVSTDIFHVSFQAWSSVLWFIIIPLFRNVNHQLDLAYFHPA